MGEFLRPERKPRFVKQLVTAEAALGVVFVSQALSRRGRRERTSSREGTHRDKYTPEEPKKGSNKPKSTPPTSGADLKALADAEVKKPRGGRGVRQPRQDD